MSQYDYLYLPNGYVDAGLLFDDKRPIVLAIGGRGIGKTYGVLEKLLQRDEKFIYMRRTQSQIDTLKFPAFNPFRSIDASICTAPIGKYVIGFYHGEFDDKTKIYRPVGEPIGVGVALSTFGSIRGIDGNDFTALVYDEFIPQRNDRKIKNEGESFLNAIESINRNRELQGLPMLHTILLSNSNSINSPIIDALGVLRMTEKMMKHRHSHGEYKGIISVYLYFNSPISEKKAKTALYQVAADKEFQGMSLENSFSEADFENIRQKPLQEYRPVVSIGEITIFQHKTNNDLYVVSGIKSDVRFTTLPNDLKAFQNKYFSFYQRLIKKQVSYADITAKIQFERIWE